MANTPEGKVKDAVKALLKERHAWYFMPVSNGMGVVGIPDIICCYRGLFIAIEAKAPGKLHTTTPNQKRVISAINTSGGMAVVVDDVSAVVDLLDTLDLTYKECPNGYVN